MEQNIYQQSIENIMSNEKLSNEAQNPPLSKSAVKKPALLNENNLQKRQIKNNRGTTRAFGIPNPIQTVDRITFFTSKDMIVGIHIQLNTGLPHCMFWNNTMEVLLDAVFNGFLYRLGLEKYKSEKSLDIRINNFIKYILADNAL